jgi:hypothetical protein
MVSVWVLRTAGVGPRGRRHRGLGRGVVAEAVAGGEHARGSIGGRMTGRTAYSRALAKFDAEAIVAALRDDVTIRVAVHDEPLQGKETAAFLFGVLTQELAPFELVEEIVEGEKSVVLFETSLRGERAHGLNIVVYRPDGLVGELTVFFRPLAALRLISEVIGSHMQRRFGPQKRP